MSPDATVRGQVLLVGGPVTRDGRTPRQAGSGVVLVFADADRSGEPLLTADLAADGSFAFDIAPGTYHLATTAVSAHGGAPGTGPSVTVTPGATVHADILCPVR